MYKSTSSNIHDHIVEYFMSKREIGKVSEVHRIFTATCTIGRNSNLENLIQFDEAMMMIIN